MVGTWVDSFFDLELLDREKDLKVDRIAWIQDDSVKTLGMAGRQKMKNPDVISAMHQSPWSAEL